MLRHSRIYILPTRRGFALIATLVIMLLTSMNYALSLGYALTFLAAGMVAAALLATFRNLAGIASLAASPPAKHLPAARWRSRCRWPAAVASASASSSRRPTARPVIIDLPADATRPVRADRRGAASAGR